MNWLIADHGGGVSRGSVWHRGSEDASRNVQCQEGSNNLRVTMVSRRVHPAHGPGGLERHVHDLLCALGRAGVQVELYAESPADPTSARVAIESFPPGVCVHWIPDRWLPLGTRPGTIVLDRITNYPMWALRVARWLMASWSMGSASPPEGGGNTSPQHQRPDLLHVHGLAGWGFGRAKAAGRLRLPLVLTTQGMEEFQAPGHLKHLAYSPFRAGMRTLAKASDRIVVTDKSLVDLVGRLLDVEPTTLVTIPNAIDPQRCRQVGDRSAAQTMLQAWGRASARPLFISVGRLAANKGFEILVEALAGAGRRLPDTWGWLLIGDGPRRQAIATAIDRAGIASHCTMAGRLSQALLHGLLGCADWFVHPTLYEGSSLATLEAMAHGLPVIASRTGGLPDKVEPNVSGFLVAPGEPKELAAALVDTVNAEAARLGAAGRRIVEADFSWSAAVSRYLDLYREVALR